MQAKCINKQAATLPGTTPIRYHSDKVRYVKYVHQENISFKKINTKQISLGLCPQTLALVLGTSVWQEMADSPSLYTLL
jgi:hypothetical protein